MKKFSRYPGTRAFEPGEQHLFFGRSDETDRLLAQVKAEPLVVVFSKSGIGKSSLVNAGLRPLLGIEGYHPIPVRVQDLNVTPVDATKAALGSFLNKEKLFEHTRSTPEEAGLWECVRACEFKRFGTPVIPVLIFDQFEEFFEHSIGAKQGWAMEMGNLIGKRIPNRVKEKLRNTPTELRTESFDQWYQTIPIRVIFAIRSDRLSLVDDLKHEIPNILSGRFHLKPLNREQAREAIVRPAELPGSDFLCPAFKYKEATIDLILKELVDSKTGTEVESFQLQLVCQHLENQIVAGKIEVGKDGLDAEAFGGQKGIQDILKNYYEHSIKELSKEERKQAKVFIEEGLIYKDRRIGIAAGLEEEDYGVKPELLTFLMRKRLIRAVNNSFGKSYEISHDAFLRPMLESLQRRKEKQRMEALAKERAQLEKERQEREAELKAQQERLAHELRLKEEALVARAEAEENARTARLRYYVSLAISLLALIFMIYAWQKKCEHHQLTGSILERNELFEDAINEYMKADLFVVFGRDSFVKKVNDIRNTKTTYEKYIVHMDSADYYANLSAEYLTKAKRKYMEASALSYKYDKSKDRLTSLDKDIELTLIKYKISVDRFIDAEGWKEAFLTLERAHDLSPSDKEVNENMLRVKPKALEASKKEANELIAKRQYTQALDVLKIANRINPNDRKIKSLMQSVEKARSISD